MGLPRAGRGTRARGCVGLLVSRAGGRAGVDGGWAEEPGRPLRGWLPRGRRAVRPPAADGAGRLVGWPSLGVWRVGERADGNEDSCVGPDILSFNRMADIHDAARKNDVDSIEASVVADAIIFLLARSGGGSHGTPPRLHRDDVAARCRNSTRRAATSMHEMGTPLPNPTFPF